VTVIVTTGSRGWSDINKITEVLSALLKEEGPLVIIHGGAIGADSLVEEVAHRLGIVTRVIRPDWKKYGKRAGLVRNDLMLDFEPNKLIAFWDGHSHGTAYTINTAKDRGIPVEIYRSNP
jgi:hypothetical protein